MLQQYRQSKTQQCSCDFIYHLILFVCHLFASVVNFLLILKIFLIYTPCSDCSGRLHLCLWFYIYVFTKETWLKTLDCHWTCVYASVSVCDFIRLITEWWKQNSKWASFFLVTAIIDSLYSTLHCCYAMGRSYIQTLWEGEMNKTLGEAVCTGVQQVDFKLKASQYLS